MAVFLSFEQVESFCQGEKGGFIEDAWNNNISEKIGLVSTFAPCRKMTRIVEYTQNSIS